MKYNGIDRTLPGTTTKAVKQHLQRLQKSENDSSEGY